MPPRAEKRDRSARTLVVRWWSGSWQTITPLTEQTWVEKPVSEMQPEWKSCFGIMDLGHLSN
ncbi:hypothetical protein HYPDE_23633 [Hyphomicrobium denitrificans 1NES1]|uniref:Uncharacterized protein n=1 Tax=Hyphomicrobium denitrificans 1NES1 TaxID=670307 RepID=N0B2K6_9HYPH|nr:hypothetical protein HYPDE_23633 [Hyphomicrobium denitrificans 1NES1]